MLYKWLLHNYAKVTSFTLVWIKMRICEPSLALKSVTSFTLVWIKIPP